MVDGNQNFGLSMYNPNLQFIFNYSVLVCRQSQKILCMNLKHHEGNRSDCNKGMKKQNFKSKGSFSHSNWSKKFVNSGNFFMLW